MSDLRRKTNKSGQEPEKEEAFRVSGRKLLIVLWVFALLLSILNIPVIYAYFTDMATSKIVVEVKKQPQPSSASANVVFYDPTSENTEQQGFDLRLSGLESEPQGFDLRSFGLQGEMTPGQEVPPPTFAPDIIRASIWLNGGFDAGDIYIPSISAHYGNYSAPALYGELAGGILMVDFPRSEILSWVDGQDFTPAELTLLVTGEGYQDGLHRFTFTGQATLVIQRQPALTVEDNPEQTGAGDAADEEQEQAEGHAGVSDPPQEEEQAEPEAVLEEEPATPAPGDSSGGTGEEDGQAENPENDNKEEGEPSE